MDEVLKKMNAYPWRYADQDPETVTELERRIAEKGADQEDPTITYSDLVRGVVFHLPDGEIYEIKDFQNHGFESQLIGDYLGFICKNSYEKAGFMASALVVLKDEKKPSSHFFRWMNELGLLKSRNDETNFWIEQVRKSQAYFMRNG
jgi:hypothetical protein